MVMKQLTFEKWEDGRWFVVFPDYEGDQEDLEMVDGADEFLDFLTTDNMFVTLKVDEEEQPGWSYLELVAHDEAGGTYRVNTEEDYDGEVWLCNVVHDIFGEHPETIWFKCID
jgi:hypothetical protein